MQQAQSNAVQMFLAKYDLRTGQLAWVSQGRPSTGTLPSYATDIILQFENPIVVGTFFDYIQLGSITLNTTGYSRGIFIANYFARDGRTWWAKSINGASRFFFLFCSLSICNSL